MKTRICAKCKKEKPIGFFGKKTGGLYQPYCKECARIYRKEHYLKNRRAYIFKAKEHDKKKKEYISSKKKVPCKDCGKEYPPYVMDFDHKRGRKDFILANGFKLSYRTIDKEIAKCDVVCANCHRIRTYKCKQRFKNGLLRNEKRNIKPN